MNDLPPTTTPPLRIVVTAGATHEPIDEVRFLGNHSSGKLGTLIAFAAADYGHDVTLLHSSHLTSLPVHPRLNSIPFTSLRDLAAKLDELWPSHSILIMTAAVSDYTPRGGQKHGKLNRNDGMSLELIPTDDLVASLAKRSREDQRIIAFALEESDGLEDAARAKLKRKQVDAIVANPLETMNSASIQATVLLKDGTTISPPDKCLKAQFAVWLIENLESITCSTSQFP
jgi:phosphopantothenoylcysteine decarboxylase/phosphopantothenate--cysteine ligase